MFMQVSLSLDVVISQLSFLNIILIENIVLQVLYSILVESPFLIWLDVEAHFIVASTDFINPVFVEEIAQRVIKAQIVLQDIEFVFIILTLLCLDLFLRGFMECHVSAILVKAVFLVVFRAYVDAVIIIEATMSIKAILIELEAFRVNESTLIQNKEATIIIVSL